jgi:hypothetical protein
VSKSIASEKGANQTTHQSFFEFYDLKWEEETKTMNLCNDTKVAQKIIDVKEQ